MYKLVNLGKKYNNKMIYENLCLEIETGNISVIKGKSGCGKTTLLRILAFLESIDIGELFFNDEKMEPNKEYSVLRQKQVGYVSNENIFVENISLMDNIRIIEEIRNETIDIEKIKRAADLLGIENLLHENVTLLSSGERQRASLLKFIIFEYRVLLLDEPTANLDLENSQMVIEIIKYLKKKGVTIITVSHDSSFDNIADKIIEIERSENDAYIKVIKS